VTRIGGDRPQNGRSYDNRLLRTGGEKGESLRLSQRNSLHSSKESIKFKRGLGLKKGHRAGAKCTGDSFAAARSLKLLLRRGNICASYRPEGTRGEGGLP